MLRMGIQHQMLTRIQRRADNAFVPKVREAFVSADDVSRLIGKIKRWHSPQNRSPAKPRCTFASQPTTARHRQQVMPLSLRQQVRQTKRLHLHCNTRTRTRVLSKTLKTCTNANNPEKSSKLSGITTTQVLCTPCTGAGVSTQSGCGAVPIQATKKQTHTHLIDSIGHAGTTTLREHFWQATSWHRQHEDRIRLLLQYGHSKCSAVRQETQVHVSTIANQMRPYL
jgi:hypothetical protein